MNLYFIVYYDAFDVWMYIYIYISPICSTETSTITTLKHMQRKLHDRQNSDIPDPWRHHQMETFSALLVFFFWGGGGGDSPVTGEFLSLRPVTRSFELFFDMRLNKQLNEQSCGWWYKTPWYSLWRHCNDRIIMRPVSNTIDSARSCRPFKYALGSNAETESMKERENVEESRSKCLGICRHSDDNSASRT